MSAWRLVQQRILTANEWGAVENNDYLVGPRLVREYLVVRRKAFVVVVAECEHGVVLIRQYRQATERHYWCLPAGYVETGEDPAQAAARELSEETGLVGRDFVYLGSLDPLPGYVASKAHVVGCVVVASAELHAADGEAVEIAVEAWPRITERILRGEINEMQAVAALHLASLATARRE